ncbi:23582_t:CDS:10 [Cetraspora pellucida]|uniref:23582_t:CDS:1 n=1 Tax=Cetraspora pellucida TaxID=1433469 RepID=A0A9N8Z3R8_9GLOM|nr:23582_t:CDS:10 [Cetraspora pellucida]
MIGGKNYGSRDVRDGEINKWVIYGYDKGGNDLKVLGSGDGGLDELQEEFNDGKIQYAYVKLKDPNSELPKIVLIGWCGEGVPEAKKGLFNSHLNEVSNFLKGYHLQINARSESDIDPSYIMKRIEESGGSKYSINVDKSKPPPKPEPILPVRSVYKPVQIPNITEMQRNAPRDRIEPVRSVYEPIKVPNMNELRRSAAQEKVEPVKSSYQPVQVPDISELQRNAPQEKIEPVRSTYQPVQVPDISELQRSAPQEKIEPVRSTYQPVQPPKPKPLSSARLAFLNAGKETDAENKYRKEREERERAEREERQREEREKTKREEQERLRQGREERESKRLERERAEREEQEREQLEREEQERAEQERDQLEQERAEQERERTEQLRRDREEQKRLDEEKKRAEKERLRRQKEEEEELLRQERLKLEDEELLRQQELESAENGGIIETKTLSARVIYPYDASEDNEMSLIEGEIIVNISKIDDGWWHGESKDGSRYGLFPANYVEPIEGEAEPDAELTTETEDDIITDIEHVSEDWWQGTSPDGVVGLFPGK